MKIGHTSEYIRYSGRIAHLPDGAHFYYAGSLAEFRFRGSRFSVTVTHKNVWGVHALTYVLDGRVGKLPLRDWNDGKPVEYALADSLDPSQEHSLILYKQSDASHALTFHNAETDGEFLAPPASPELKLEFYGDSVTSGVCCEPDDFAGCADPAGADCIYDNVWYSYAVRTALSLHADFHLIAQGGIAVYDRTGYFSYPETVGMESVYDKLCYFPEAGELTEWDFSRYTPDLLIFALGQNDQHDPSSGTNSNDIHDPATREHWMQGYEKIARSVLDQYGGKPACIFLLTVLNHDAGWDEAAEEVSRRLAEKGYDAHYLHFNRCGIATHGHPRRAEQQEMAEELTAFIRSLRTSKT
ncbi:MAG: electron transporter RnfD [Oscillospiraceae bacterium]|nr:electron transporter RnfD [Oscillospiraceae bacterium]